MSTTGIIVSIITAIVSFLLGSIPCGVIVSKVFYGKDVRETGSGNIGFTNSLRSMGKAGGVAVFAGDFVKGLLAAALGMWLFPVFFKGSVPLCLNSAEFLSALATLFATLGHIFSPWLGWKGGKGISTAFGASFISMNSLVACCLFAAFLLVVIFSKYVSAGSITAAALFPIAGSVARPHSALSVVCFAIVGVVVIWAHRGNIARLIDGTERKISSKKKEE